MDIFGTFSSVFHILLVVLGIGLVIAVHELGHFLAGLWAGAKIERFAIGFGPRLFGFMWRGIDICVRVLPLGGYVKYIGENPGEDTTDNRPTEDRHGNPVKLQGKYSFERVPVGKRAVIAVAGVTMNFIFGIVCYAVALMVGLQVRDQSVGYVQPDSPAAVAGVQVDDRIVAVGGRRVIGFGEAQMEILMSEPGKPLSLTVHRDGQEKILEVVPETGPVMGIKGFSQIGIESASKAVAGRPSAARMAGLKVDDDGTVTDEIVAVNDKPVTGVLEAVVEVGKVTGGPVVLTVRRDGKEVTLDPIRHYTVGVRFEDEPSLKVEAVEEGSPAEKAGLKAEDVIVGIEGQTFTEGRQITQYIGSHAGKPVDLAVRRNESRMIVRATPKVFEGEQRARLGFQVSYMGSTGIESVAPGSPAEAAGLKSGDVIEQVLGLPVPEGQKPSVRIETAMQFRMLVDTLQGKPVKLSVKSADVTREVTVEPSADLSAAPYTVGIGADPTFSQFPRQGPVDALVLGVGRMRFAIRQVYLTIVKIAGTPSAGKGIGGPILIAQASYRSSQMGIGRLLWFLGLIGINLAFINLLPIPVLDGGLLVFLGLEAVMGRRPPERVLVVAQMIGLVLLLLLMAFVMYNDIARLIGAN